MSDVPTGGEGATASWPTGLVSVVVHAGDGVDRAVASAVSQATVSVEVLVIGDDGDLPPDTIQLFDAGPSPGAARNEAVRASRGDYLVFLGLGERLLPDTLRAGIDLLDAHPHHGFFWGRTRRVSADGSTPRATTPHRQPTTDLYLALVRGDAWIEASAALLYRRAAVEAVGGFDPSLRTNLDLDLCLRILRSVPAVVHGTIVAQRAAPLASEPAAVIESMQILRAQRPHLEHRPSYRAAFRTGRHQLARRHGVETFEALRTAVRSGSRPTRGAAADLARTLVALTRANPGAVPGTLVSLVGPGFTRRWSTWRRFERGVAATTPAPGSPQQLAREAARATVPRGTVLAVLGDEPRALSDLDGVDVRYLRPEIGTPAPAQVEAMDAQGASLLLVPSWMFWWLDHYQPGLRLHLDVHHELLWSDDSAMLYRLQQGVDRAPARALVAGFFSFEDAGATAGDLLVRDVVCEWLSDAGVAYDVAHAAPFAGGVDWRTVDPGRFSHLVFVCGPWLGNAGQNAMLRRFGHCRRIGLNLSMAAAAHPFDLLLERDSATVVRPDLSLASKQRTVPVIGVCLREHADGTRVAHAAIERLVAGEHVAVVDIDTRLDTNTTGLRSAAEIEAVLARMDVVVTTRLHGMVLALKHGVPVVAVDPEAGGGKITRQASALGWPTVLTVDALPDEALRAALTFCLTDEARARAKGTGPLVAQALRDTRDTFVSGL